jgi:hypothetical protein
MQDMRTKNKQYSRLTISDRNQQISDMLEYAPRGRKAEIKGRLTALWGLYEGLDDFAFANLQRIAKAGKLEEGLVELEQYYKDNLKEIPKIELALRVHLGMKASYFIGGLAKKVGLN